MTFKKSLTATLAGSVLLMGILSACGGNKAENNSTADQGSTGKGGKVTLNVWGMGEEAKSLPKIAEQFEAENPDIKINVQPLPWDTAHDKLLTAVASKKGPDVVQMGTTWIPEFANAGALMDLSSDIANYPELADSNFYDGSLNTTKYDGKTVGVPWYIDTRVLYYRTDLLKEVGYDQAPKTWDELKDAADKLKARGANKYGISLDVKEQTLMFMFARQNGSKLIDGNKPLFNEPQFVEAVDYLNSFFKDGDAPLDLGIDIVAGFKGDGILPMFISGPWMVKLINDQAPELKGKWATAVLPAKENNISALGGSNLSVFQYTDHKEEAMKFLAYMSKPETQLKWLELANALPSTKKAWEDPALTSDPNLKVIGEQMKSSEPMPLLKPWEQVAQEALNSFEKVYRGQTKTQDEMNSFNKKATDILSK
ncbi:sugar ABC transporter substrate-binding protein [Paenibacillus sp. JDR-2]|uniref:sugar ABC transporter substrate-binding protein n=1 Tax=Paenibacillus sp. (strain JDR-2) TaxID=324057 RepID=UPI000166B114|nr:sugar ABC transporter substrate-binding protein [Paenibacillus sp. JDR-2]ACS99244.1 extracellular solute-binding protein family 1 [Paenibacillus sp. JDR-2]